VFHQILYLTPLTPFTFIMRFHPISGFARSRTCSFYCTLYKTVSEINGYVNSNSNYDIGFVPKCRESGILPSRYSGTGKQLPQGYHPKMRIADVNILPNFGSLSLHDSV
jgi:hypothetical protein